MRYAHTNIVAHDCERLIKFYTEVFGLKRTGQRRDISGEWLDGLTGIAGAHIVGEHLAMPGYGDNGPTLEIFTYDSMEESAPAAVNRCGFGHIAFEVEDVNATLAALKAAGGSQLGKVVTTSYPDGRKAIFVYAADPEGNAIELQTWF